METKQLAARRHRSAIFASLPGIRSLARIEPLSVDTMLKYSAISQARNSNQAPGHGVPGEPGAVHL